jgi:hypothetical protein
MESKLIKLAKKVAEIADLGEERKAKINDINDLKSDLFIELFEKICKTTLIDKRVSLKYQDQVHNNQAIIDSLSFDILQEDLSYLTGEALTSIESNPKICEYFLEILISVNDWMNNSASISIRNDQISTESQQDQQKEEEEANKETKKETNEETKEEISEETKEETNEETKEEDYFQSYMKQKRFDYFRNQTLLGSDNLSLNFDKNCNISDVNDSQVDSALSQSINSSLNDNKRRVVLFKVDNELKKISKILNKKKTKSDIAIMNEIEKMNQIYKYDLKEAQLLIRNEIKQQNEEEKEDEELNLNPNPIKNKTKLLPKVKALQKGVLISRNKKMKLKTSKSPNNSIIINENNDNDGLLSYLLNKFPFLNVPTDSIHYLWQKQAKQLETLAKLESEINNKSNTSIKCKNELDKVYNRQQMLMNIIKKDLNHTQRIQDLKRMKTIDNTLKNRQVNPILQLF